MCRAMTPGTSETETIAQAMRGDEASQRRLYEENHSAAFRLAFLLLRNTHDAEEVVQDAFVYAFRNLERYDSRQATFWTWLRVILVSRCRNKRRRKRLSRVSLDALRAVGLMPADPEPSANPALMLERSEARRVIWEALRQVSPGARDALILRYYGGMSYAEIAETLGCSRDAARSRVAHGKVQMRRLLTVDKRLTELELSAAWIGGSRS
jgi:RNA polymerase sigma-70 factor (ECF subfamily)